MSPQGMIALEFEQAHYLFEVVQGVVRVLANETIVPTSYNFRC
jgi:hypothetical protein